MTDEVITTPPVAGSPEETGSQVSVPAPQGDEQTQPAGQPTVEGEAQHTSSQTTERPKVSDFYEKRERERQRFRNMETQIQQLSEQLRELGSKITTTVEPKREPSPDEMERLYWSDPQKWALEREKKLKDEFENKLKILMEKTLPETIQKNKSQEDLERKGQEALELLFPKDNISPKSTLEERLEKDPERTKRILRILKETGLDEASKYKPIESAKAVLALCEMEVREQTKPNPNAPKKGHMVSVATGTPAGSSGGKKTMTLDEIKVQMRQLDERLEENPDLRYDDKWKAQRDQLKQELMKRHNELSQGQ